MLTRFSNETLNWTSSHSKRFTSNFCILHWDGAYSLMLLILFRSPIAQFYGMYYILGNHFRGPSWHPYTEAGSKGLVFMINFSRSTFKVIYQVIFSVTTCHLFGYLKRLGGTKRGKYSFEVCPCFKRLKGRLALPLIHESTRTLKSSFPPELEVATMVIKY